VAHNHSVHALRANETDRTVKAKTPKSVADLYSDYTKYREDAKALYDKADAVLKRLVRAIAGESTLVTFFERIRAAL